MLDFAAGCGASPRQCEDIALGVSEALTNAVLHAYVDDPRPGEMAVRASLGKRSLEVVVSDAGKGMQARRDSPGLGLGLKLIARVSDRVLIEDAMPGVRVRMTFAMD